ncbi:hypothetical protein ACFLYR_03935 [Chloroflexota bacterium]
MTRLLDEVKGENLPNKDGTEINVPLLMLTLTLKLDQQESE